MKPTLSLCMIVKDEEAQLPRCLASVRGVVDELVVVDTGSTDRTVEIARGFGARVVQHPWDGSFSSARNVSLDHATADYVLILDADEALADGAALRAGLEAAAPETEAFILPLVNFVGERANEEAVTSPSVRLFRNRPEYRFTRALHEQIMFAIQQARPEARIEYLNAAIDHYGYLNAIVADKDKIRRNLALAEEEVKRYPTEAFSWYNLGQEHFRLREWDQAIAAYQKAFPYLESLAAGFAPALVKHLVVCLLNSGRPREVIAVTEDAKEAYPAFTDLWVLQGLALMQLGDFAPAAQQFDEALAKGEVGGGFFISDEGVGSYKAVAWRGTCHAQLGWLERAREDYLAAASELRQRQRYLPQALDGLVQLAHLRRLEPPQVLAEVRAAIDPADPRWRQLAGRVLITRGYAAVAEELLADEAELAPETLLALGVHHLRSRRTLAAVGYWRRIPSDSPERLTADWHELLGLVALQQLEAAERLFRERLQPRGESALVALYRGLLALWTGQEATPPELSCGQATLQAHLADVLELLLQAGGEQAFEQALPALDWVGYPEVAQATLLGRLYDEAGLGELAMGALLLAVEGGDTSRETLRRLGLGCLRQGAYAEAETLLAEVLRQEEASGVAPTPHNATLLGYLAALTAQGRHDEAEPQWQRLLNNECSALASVG